MYFARPHTVFGLQFVRNHPRDNIGPLCNLCVSIQSDTWFCGTDNLAHGLELAPLDVSTAASILSPPYHSSLGHSVIPTQVLPGCIPAPDSPPCLCSGVQRNSLVARSINEGFELGVYPLKRYRRNQSHEIGACYKTYAVGPTSQSCCICYMCNDVVLSSAMCRYWHDFTGIIEGIQR
jgi:hypothetical protein